MSTRRILHLLDLTGPGGAQVIYLDLVSRLDPTAWESIAAVPGPGWVFDALRARGVQPVVTPVKRGPFDWRYLARLIGVIRRERVDLVQAHLLGPAIYGAMAALVCRVPLVASFHGQVDVAPDERFRAVKFGLLNRAACRVVFVSEALRRHFLSVSALRPERAVVIPNGVDFEALASGAREGEGGGRASAVRFRAECGVTSDQVLVGAIGHIRRPKAYEVLLEAARLAHDRNPGLRFAIVGRVDDPVYYEELLRRRRELGLESVVHFAGARDDVGAILPALDLYLLTSSSEGFSLSLVQAQAAGVPAIATRCGGPEEILIDGETGILADVGDASAIAAAVTRLGTADAEWRDRMVRAGQQRAREYFDVRAMVRRYEQLYRECTAA